VVDIETVSERLEALGALSRLEIFRLLVRAGADGLPVGEVQRRTGIARSTLTHHLKKLIAVGLIEQCRVGTTLYCCVRLAEMRETLAYLNDQCCADMGSSACAPAPERAKELA